MLTKYAFPALFLLLAALSGAFIGALKVDAFRSWRYTSDLFTYDTVVQETARGHPGLEFTYGNTFGDHAYIFLVLLAPLKVLLQSNMIYALLLAGPLAYALSSVVLFFAARGIAGGWKALLVSITYLAGFSIMYRGLFENTYGMHPDTLAGFLAAALAAVLAWREQRLEAGRQEAGQNTAGQEAGAVLLLLAFGLLKEEMAILAVCFFAVLSVLRRSRFAVFLLLLSGLLLVFELIVIQLSKTPFNRTNETLLGNFFERVAADGLVAFYTHPRIDNGQGFIFWLVILLSTALFSLALGLSRRIQAPAAALFLAGLLKFGLSVLVFDYNLATWHNFPAVTMVMTAVLLQALSIDRIRPRWQAFGLGLLAAASLACFLSFDLPFAAAQFASQANRKPEIAGYAAELAQLRQRVDPLRVVAIPQYTAQAWVGYRYSFYPRGVSWSPVGIADYVVYPSETAARLAGGYERFLPLDELGGAFAVIAETPNFTLLERQQVAEADRPSRELFFQTFGNDSLHP